jgi:deazaflavin-dependent oxidoreductase (nitroreductase family)
MVLWYKHQEANAKVRIRGMPMSDTRDEATDSPVGWVAEHIKSYVETDGKSGQRYSGKDALLITTRGRKSGLLRRTALFYGKDGERYIVVGSNGGKATHPDWYLNLLEDPAVEVQDGAEKFAARARPATPEERPRLWAMMITIFPSYAGFEKKTRREIPVVLIERT